MSAKLVVIPIGNVQDIPRGLRRLADQIEAGEFGAVDTLAWTVDADLGAAMGLLGGREASDAHLLFSVAAARMVQAVIDGKPLQ